METARIQKRFITFSTVLLNKRKYEKKIGKFRAYKAIVRGRPLWLKCKIPVRLNQSYA